MWTTSPKSEEPRTAPAPVPVEPSRAAVERRTTAWVGKSVVFKGELLSLEDLTIDGRIEGRIEVRDHMVVIGPDADIRAEVAAGTVIIRGKVVGRVTATDKVQLGETASVQGDIISPRIAMAEGAHLLGRVDTAHAADAEGELDPVHLEAVG